MAVAADRVRPKTAADLLGWLEREVSPHLVVETRAIAHGGTALALLDLHQELQVPGCEAERLQDRRGLTELRHGRLEHQAPRIRGDRFLR